MPDETAPDHPKPGSPIKVRYADGEVGWATYLGHDLVRIDNIPLVETLNYHDIALITYPEGCPPRVEIVVASEFDHHETIWYDTVAQYLLLNAIFRIFECVVEGGVEPGDGTRGFMTVACPKNVLPRVLATAIGIIQPPEKAPVHAP